VMPLDVLGCTRATIMYALRYKTLKRCLYQDNIHFIWDRLL
jgi:hypothetical protein